MYFTIKKESKAVYFTGEVQPISHFFLRSNVRHSMCVLQDVRRSLCLCWRWRPLLSGLEQKEVCPPKWPWQPWNEPLLLASRWPRKGKGSVVAAWRGDPHRLVGRAQDATCAHKQKNSCGPYSEIKRGCVYCFECWDGEKTVCQQPVLIYVTSSSVRECATTSQVCLYLSIFIKTACLSVFWV